MLIVVIIIGILMSALLPRLKGAQERARDTARKANLSQISTALEMYFNDKGTYPNGTCVEDIKKEIVPRYMSALPRDPQNWRITYGTKNDGCKDWIYGYTPLTKNGASSGWAVLVANIEAFWKVANYVLSWSNYKSTPEFAWNEEVVDNLDLRICDNGVEYTWNTTVVTCNKNNKTWQTKDNMRMVFVRFN